jgi:S1-C subfamily serine protease
MTDLAEPSLKFFRAGSNEHFEIKFDGGNFPQLKLPHQSQAFVMTVIHLRDQQIRALGSCFSISNRGLLVTARHVIDEVKRIHASASEESGECCAVLCMCPNPTPEQPDNFAGGALPILDVWTNPFLDIAFMLVELPVHDVTKEYLPIGAMALSPGIPAVGQPCIGLGYTQSKWQRLQEPGPFEILQSYNATRGMLEEIHFPGRDQRLNFPCFLTDARFDLGMSGGPIVSATGQVCGVICSGTEIDDPAIPRISYGSLIGPALAMTLKMTAGSVTKGFFLWDLVRGGEIFCDQSCASLSVKRDANSIEIDFGGDCLIRNRLG